MAPVERGRRGLKVGDSFVSKFGTNLCLTVTEVDDVNISFIVQRRVIDRKTGEILVEDRERTVTPKGWAYVAAGYVRTRTPRV